MPTKSLENTDELAQTLKSRLDVAIEVQQTFLGQWDAHERLFMARQATSSTPVDSRIYEGSLTTNVLERAIRTTAQLPTGTFYRKGLDNDDSGFLMGLMFDNHTLKHANSQYSSLTKLRISGIYKHLYGSIAARAGYKLRDGKIYADFRLSEARSLYLQPNRFSSADMDWIIEGSVVSVATLKQWKTDTTGTWVTGALDKLIERLSLGAIATSRNDSRKMSVNEQNSQRPSEKGDGATTDVYECYERGMKGKTYTFVLESIKTGSSTKTNVSILRTKGSFMPDGSLPYSINLTIPLLDRAYGLGDFERNKTIQMAIDSGASMGMSALALKTLPPVAIPTQGVVESTIRLAPMAKWRTDNPEKIQAINLAPDAIAAHQTMNGTLHSFLMNNQGSTDMQIASQQGGTQMTGKTPAAIDKQNTRQDTKDAWDVEMNEEFVQELFTKLANIQANVVTKPVTFWVHGTDVARLQKSNVPQNMYKISDNGKHAEITVTPKYMKGEYEFVLDKGSAFSKNDADEAQALQDVFTEVTSNPVTVQLLQAEGTSVKLGEIIERRLSIAGVKDADKIVQVSDEMNPQEQEEAAETQQQQQAEQQGQVPQGMQPAMNPVVQGEPDAFHALANHPDPQVQALAQLHAQQLMQAAQQQQQGGM